MSTGHPHREFAPGAYVTASLALVDAAPASDDGFVGMAVKQQAPGADTPRANLANIALGEKYYLLTTGESDFKIPDGLVVAKGTPLHIGDADNVLYLATAAGRSKFGRVAAIGPERGLPSGWMTVNHEFKDF